MTQWAVTDLVSRVAGRVSTAGGGIAAQFAERRGGGDLEAVAYAQLRAAFPLVDPSPEFLADLYRRLLEESVLGPAEYVLAAPADRRIVYGAAALGSLASAAVIAAVVLRYRAAHRAAA